MNSAVHTAGLLVGAASGLFVLAYLIPDALMHHLGWWTLASTQSKKMCALTFDDGPDPVWTPLILDILRAHDCHATFFVVGKKAAALPDVMERMAREGHEVALHGWDHRHPWLLGPLTCRLHLARTARATQAYRRGPKTPKYRTPWGFWSLWTALGSIGYPRVMWSLAGEDWKSGSTPESVAARVTGGIAGGSIVLLHDGARYSWKTAAALEAILLDIEEKGLRQVTVAELEEEPVAT